MGAPGPEPARERPPETGCPATSNPRNLRDNMEAGRGRLPDPELRERMAEHFAALA